MLPWWDKGWASRADVYGNDQKRVCLVPLSVLDPLLFDITHVLSTCTTPKPVYASMSELHRQALGCPIYRAPRFPSFQ